MRAGKLDKIIRIKTVTYTDTPDGGQIPVTTYRENLRAQLIEESTEEFMRAAGTSTERVRIFRTRYLDGVTLVDRVEYLGLEYDLKQIKEIGRRRGLELRCTQRG